MNEDITNYPLSWPINQPRTPFAKRKSGAFMTRRQSRFGSYQPTGKHSIAESAKELDGEIRRMGGRDMIISSNMKVKANGMPYSNQTMPDDPGIAVYFKWKQKDLVFACDKWMDPRDNLWAIVKHLEALRGQERWGVGSLDQAFAGYAALPDPNQRAWWEVLNVSRFATDDEINRAHIELAKRYHPDREGGSTEIFIQVQQAFEMAKGRNG